MQPSRSVSISTTDRQSLAIIFVCQCYSRPIETPKFWSFGTMKFTTILVLVLKINGLQ